MLQVRRLPLRCCRPVTVADAGRVRQQVADRDRARRVDRIDATVLTGDGDGGGGIFRQEVADGLGDEQRAAFLQHHHRRTDHGLGHGRDAEDRVRLHGCVAFAVAEPGRTVVDGLAVEGDLQDRTRNPAFVDIRVKEAVDARETFGGHLRHRRYGEHEYGEAGGAAKYATDVGHGGSFPGSERP